MTACSWAMSRQSSEPPFLVAQNSSSTFIRLSMITVNGEVPTRPHERVAPTL